MWTDLKYTGKKIVFLEIFLLFFWICLPLFAAEENASSFQVRGKAAIMGDIDTGRILFEQNADAKLEPASLTKVMTLYIIYQHLAKGDLRLDASLPVSEKAWKMEGSKTFVKVGDLVKVEDLIQGIAVQSGNDACVVIAEHLAGTEEGFAQIMNTNAKELGMTGTHFMNATGLPHLTQAIITHFPQYIHFSSEKQYTFNGIQQHNRNRLLWRDPSFTGLKTGHTNNAGYCLIATNEKDGQKLAAVVLGAEKSKHREEDALRLIHYGNRVYETVHMYKKDEVVRKLRVWKAAQEEVEGVLEEPLHVTVARKDRDSLEVGLLFQSPLIAPLAPGEQIATLVVKMGDNELLRRPIITKDGVEEGNIFRRMIDAVRLKFGW
ncbi:MAG: D-alanyl-D-alanine carboxypeptidase [Magnetococcus sp. DMHC-6]